MTPTGSVWLSLIVQLCPAAEGRTSQHWIVDRSL